MALLQALLIATALSYLGARTCGAIFGEFAAAFPNGSHVAPECDDRCVIRALKSIARGSDFTVRDPYISIIVSGRNDDYGHGFLHRLQTFVRVWGWQCARLGLEIEIVIVEWNPPEGAISLRDAIVWPHAFVPIQFVIVSAEAHGQLWRMLHGAKPAPAPMLDMVAQNVGVQQARGEFVLLTNPDALPSNDLAAFLRSRALRRDTYYRIDRDDLGSPVPQWAGAAEIDAFCDAHSYRVFSSWGLAWWPAVANAASFMLEHRNYSAAFQQWRASFASPEGRPALAETEPVHNYYGLHHTTAGDFILVAREHMMRLRGFPERVSHRYWDSYMVALLAAAGLRQGILQRPLRLFHQPHRKQRAGDGFGDFVRAATQMLTERDASPLNPPHWGLLLLSAEERRAHVRVLHFRSTARLGRRAAAAASSRERQWMRLLLRDSIDALSGLSSASPRLCHPGPEMDALQPPDAVANAFVLIANRLLDERRSTEALACYHGALEVLGGRLGLPRARASADSARVLLNANIGAWRALEVLGRMVEADDAAMAVGHILAAADPFA
jgi:hypothetical protein